MHPLIPIEALDQLTDFELLRLEASLRDIILTRDLDDADLANCLASLSNAVFVRERRHCGRSLEIRTP